jgi:CheY-like chemotaxis protein
MRMSEQTKRKVLVVDDEPDAVEFVKAVMEHAGYEVESASNGAQCLEKLQKVTPDLVILDVQMPGGSGFFTMQKIKTNPETGHVPVIMLTGVGERLGVKFSQKDLYDFLGHEPDAYIEKPIEPTVLLRCAEKLLGTGQSKTT